MIIVVDSNILFSAIIKDSFTRRLLFEIDHELIFLEVILEEIEIHKEEIAIKAKLKREDMERVIRILLKNISIVPTEILKPYEEQAEEIMGRVDSKDVPFIDCALAFPGATIWTDDSDFEKRDKIKILKKKQIKEMLDQE